MSAGYRPIVSDLKHERKPTAVQHCRLSNPRNETLFLVLHHIDVYIETLYIHVSALHGTTVLTHSSPSLSHLSPVIL